MRKTIAAVTAGLLLVAGQVAAANNSAVARVGAGNVRFCADVIARRR